MGIGPYAQACPCRYIHSSLYRLLLALALDFRSPIEAKSSEVSLKMALSCRQTCRQFHKGANTRSQLVAPAAT